MLTVRAITNTAALDSFQHAWEQCYRAAQCTLPFQQFVWMKRWWAVFARSGRLVNDHLLVLTLYDQDQLVGIAPLFRTVWGFDGALGFKYIRPLGSDPNITEITSLIVLPNYEAAAQAAIGHYLQNECRSWDLLKLCTVPQATAHPPAFAGAKLLGGHYECEQEVFLLPLAPTWDEFAARLKRNIKESIRKCYNAPARDGMTFEYLCLEDPDAILEHLPDFYRLHSMRASLDNTVQHPDVFAPALHRDFFSRATADLSARGSMRLFALKRDGAVVAVRLGFVADDTLYLYFSGYDPAYGKYSIMTRLLVETIKYAIAKAISTINLSPGRDVSKTRWNPEVMPLQSQCYLSNSWRARLFFLVGYYRKSKAAHGRASCVSAPPVAGERLR